jgi:hypothetical protein
MLSSGSIEHHRPIKFVEVEIPADASFTVTTAADGRTLTVTGVCPACGGHTSTDFPYGIGGYGYKGLTRRANRQPDQLAVATILCECGHGHPGRPDGQPDLGCGRFWTMGLARP